MYKAILLFCCLLCFSPSYSPLNQEQDYEVYHQQVIEAEGRIAAEKYEEALQIYEELFDSYDFVFLREYQIATQLALQLSDTQKARQYLKSGILAGWKMKSIKKNKFLSPLREGEEWESIKKAYRNLKKQHQAKLNQQIRKQVKKMFSKDQWKAFGVFLTFSSKGQDRRAEKKFAPHSEKQMAELATILDSHGYPGERLIGNNYWMSTILSHHNSISTAYASQDQHYPSLKPRLEAALKKGQISPFERAFIDDWYISVKNNRTKTSYGFLAPPLKSSLFKTNQLRAAAFLRSVELRNKLVEVQEKTGINCYLPGRPWIDGKIAIK